MKRTSLIIALTFSLSLLSGCSFIQEQTQGLFGPPKEGSQSKQEDSKTNSVKTSPGVSKTSNQQGIEVVWEVPSEPVDAFIVRYGHDRNKLTKEVKISTADIKPVPDQHYGKVFKYIIQPVDRDKTLFVSIAAVKGKNISEFSAVVEESREVIATPDPSSAKK